MARRLLILFLASFAFSACSNSPPGVSPGGGEGGGGGSSSIEDGGDSSDAGFDPADAGAAACSGKTYGSGTYDWTLTHDGHTRTFRVHVPPSYDATRSTPLVFNFHGYTSYGTQQEEISGMDAIADQYGFIVVYADGLTGQETGLSLSPSRSWNAGDCCAEAQYSNQDDVGFVVKMLDLFEQRFCVDAKRVYSTGFSNGGFLSHRLACELSSRIAAIGPVAGVNGMSSCNPGRPVPVLHFHGTSDAVVPYNGNASFVSVDTSMAGWASRNGCASGRQFYSQTGDVTCERYPNCAQDSVTELCSVADGGHEWPGGEDFSGVGLGYTTQAVNASREIWLFFAAHPMP